MPAAAGSGDHDPKLSYHAPTLRIGSYLRNQGMVGETTTRGYINFWEPVRDQALRGWIYEVCLAALMGADA